MHQVPARTYTRQDDIARLEALVTQLPDEAIVELHLSGGRVISGVVPARPAVQQFRDADGNEGTNAVVRLDDLEPPGKAHYLWLDEVQRIVHLGTD